MRRCRSAFVMKLLFSSPISKKNKNMQELITNSIAKFFSLLLYPLAGLGILIAASIILVIPNLTPLSFIFLFDLSLKEDKNVDAMIIYLTTIVLQNLSLYYIRHFRRGENERIVAAGLIIFGFILNIAAVAVYHSRNQGLNILMFDIMSLVIGTITVLLIVLAVFLDDEKKEDEVNRLNFYKILSAGDDFVPFTKNNFFTVSYRDVSVAYRSTYRRNYFFREGTQPLPADNSVVNGSAQSQKESFTVRTTVSCRDITVAYREKSFSERYEIETSKRYILVSICKCGLATQRCIFAVVSHSKKKHMFLSINIRIVGAHAFSIMEIWS